LEILNQIHGLRYDRMSNQIRVGNETNVLYLVDGVVQAKEYTLNLPPDRIARIEVDKDPKGRFQSMGYGAVICITTVKKAGDSFSFDVRSTYWQGLNTDLTEQLNVNWRKNGWDVFGTFYFNHNEWIQDRKMEQKTFVDTLLGTEQHNVRERNERSFAGNCGCELRNFT